MVITRRYIIGKRSLNNNINEKIIIISLYIIPICLLFIPYICYIMWMYPILIYFLYPFSMNIILNVKRAFILQIIYTICSILFILSLKSLVGEFLYYPYPQYIINLLAIISAPLMFIATAIFILLSIIFIIDSY